MQPGDGAPRRAAAHLEALVIAATLDELRVPIDSVHAYGRNPRRGDVAAIKRSLEVNGQYRPIVVNQRTGEVLAGNHTWAAAVELGWDVIAATFVDVDDEEAARIALVDNRTNDLAGYDDGDLATLLQSLDGLGGTAWEMGELDQLLATLGQQGVPDTEPGPVPAEPVTRAGDLYVLGEHRLLCGDAADGEHVARLVGDSEVALGLADPPYNTGEDYGTYSDDLSEDKYVEFCQAWFGLLERSTRRQIVTPGWNNLRAWGSVKRFRAIGAWTKSNAMTRGSVSRFNTWEPILFFGAEWPRIRPADVFDFPVKNQDGGTGRPVNGVEHPCPKPLDLWAELIGCYSAHGEYVFDPFAGAGTVVIAAEQTRRRALMIEIDPGYCDVIVDRWRRHTGGEATLQEVLVAV